MSFRRIKIVVLKEFQELFRDHRMLAIIFLSPIIQLIIFGYSTTYDIHNIPTAIIDRDNSEISRRVISSLQASSYFKIEYTPQNQDEITELLESGDIWCGIEIPPDFSTKIAGGETANISVLLDANNSNSASIVASYYSHIVANISYDLLKEQLAEKGLSKLIKPTGQVNNEIRIWYNPDLKSRNFNVPAVVVQLLVVITLVLTSMAIVKEREYGTMEQLVVTPIKSRELIIGKALPYAFIGMVDIVLVTAVAVFYFQVPLLGSLLALFVCAMIFMISTLSIGLFISTISSTQQQAMISAFFFMMPAILLSGFAFPIENMPTFIQYITYLNPLRYFIIIIRAIFLKGVGIQMLMEQIIPLLIFGLVMLTFSAFRFRKRLK